MSVPPGCSPEEREAAIAEILRRHEGKPGLELVDSVEDWARSLEMMLPAMHVEHLLELFSAAGQRPLEPYYELADELVAWQRRFDDA